MALVQDNPILRREFRARLRPRAIRGNKALLYAVYVLCFIIVYAYARGLIMLAHSQRGDARDLFMLLTYGLLTLVTLIGPALAATAISQEREQQTWDILAVTRLSPWQVVFGKWIGRQFLILIGFVVILPFLLGAAIKGQIPLGAAWFVVLMLVVATNFYTALGLLCSWRARRTPTATAFALVLTALLCVGTVVINLIVESFGLWYRFTAGHAEAPVLWVNPFYATSVGLSVLMPAEYGGSPPAEAASVMDTAFVFMIGVTIYAAAWMSRHFRELNAAG